MSATTIRCKPFGCGVFAHTEFIQSLLLQIAKLGASLIVGLAFYTAAAASTGDPVLGKLVWENNDFKCVNCHSDGLTNPEGNRFNAANASNVISYAIANKYGNNSNNNMGYLAVLTQAQLDNVAAYIATFVPNSMSQTVSYNTAKVFAIPNIALNTWLPPVTTFTTIATISPPTKGTVSYTYSGNTATATYTPFSGQAGADSFTYVGRGPAGDSNIRTVSLTINAPAPVVANPGAMTAASGSSFSYQISATNAPTSYSVSATGLTLSVNSNGLVTGSLPAVSSPTSYSITISASNAGGTGSETFTLTINPPIPVVTNPGAMTAASGANFSYQITATNSPTSYSVSATSLSLTVGSGGLVTGTLPVVTSPTSYSITISASNVTGTDSETFTLTINPPIPVVTNPGAMTAASGANFSYQITATNSPTSYSVIETGLTLSVGSGGLVTGTLPVVTSPTSYSITISASNVTGTDSETFTLTINPPIPVVTNPGAMTAASGANFSYQITATNSPTSYSVSATSLSLTVGSGGLVTGTLPVVTSPTSYSITISASNVTGTDSETFTLTINPPIPVVTNPGTMSATSGAAFSYQIIATNSPTSYSVSATSLSLTVGSGGLVTGTLPAVGSPTSYSVTISASNVTGTDSQTFTLIVNPAGAPEVNNPGPITMASGANFSYQIIATNTPISYSVSATSLPLTEDSGGLVTGTLPTVASPTNYSVTISASNAIGTGSQTFILTINPPAPVVTNPGAVTAVSGTNFSYQISATNTPSSYSVVAPGLILSVSSSGLVAGVLPTVASATDYDVTLNVSNVAGTGSQTFTLTINPLPAPVVTDPGDMTALSGANFSYQIIANNSPTSYSVSTSVGLTLSVDGGGLVTGTLPAVTSPTSYSVTVSASSITGTGSKTFTLTVNPLTPVVSNPGSILAASGAIFSYQIIASNTPTNYSVVPPAGLPLSVDSGGLVTGTLPAVTSPLSYSIGISASNATGTDSQTFTLTINPSAPDVTPPGSMTRASGDTFSYQIIATNSPTGYSVTASGLGLSVDGGGLVTGTLPVVTSEINFSITVTATNVSGSSSQTFTLTVNPQAPVAGVATMIAQVNTATTLDLAPFITGSVTSVNIVVDVMHGSTAVNGTQVTYTPMQDHFGSDSFSYVATGSGGSSAPALVTVTVVGRPDPSKNAIVIGLLTSQIETPKRFAKAQIANFHQRMESLHRSSPAISATDQQEQMEYLLTKRNVSGNFYDTSAQFEAMPPTWSAYQATIKNNPSRILESGQVATESSPSQWANLLVNALTTSSVSLSALAADNGDFSSDEQSGNVALWGAGNIRLGKRNQDTSKQVDFRTDGASLGFDKRIDEDLAIGMGLGYARDKSKIGTDGTESTSSARSLALYGSYLPTPTIFVDVLLGFAGLNMDTSRYVLPADDFAQAHRKGNQIFSSLAAGYEYRVNHFLISPYGRIDMVSNRLASSTESGAGSYALGYSSQSWSTSQSVVGLRAESSHLTGIGWLLPHARVEYQRNIEQGQVANLVYADQPSEARYSIYPMTANARSVAAGLGFGFEMRNGFKLALDYQSMRAVGSVGSAGEEENHALSLILSKQLGGQNDR